MNVNYHRYPKTEQLITAKRSVNALKQGSSRTHSVLRQQVHNCKNTRLRAVAYAENFHGGVSFSGIWWSFVFGAHCLWCQKL